MPSSYIDTIDLLKRLKWRQSRFLIITIYMVEGWSHSSIVHVTNIVPYAILLVDSHVTHLDRQEILYYWLPNATVIDIGCNAKHRRLTASIVNAIESRLAHVTEICLQITIAQKTTPFFGSEFFDQFLS